MSLSIAVIDYGAGNLRSIRRALEAAGAQAIVSSDSGDVRRSDAVVFPGVGAAGAAMDRLHQLGLVDVIGDVVAEGRPFLGICLGMQLLFEHQEEGDTRGLGLLKGRVNSLSSEVKVPQIGWNRVRWVAEVAGYRPTEEDDFYFVHSYVIEPEDASDVVAVTRYGEVFPSIVRHGHVWGTQFHPEKSGPAGLKLIAGWVDDVRANAGARQASVLA
ncbi:MAG TPA: imidazole glycerol phosphate synthase subunit HisH [Thermomicrobiales bacterium]|nr:imidazole glycerol phosphate synthase subunit HisH [Thermomicrobiales bacterium]